MSAPRMRTLPEAIKEIKSLDPNTALTLTALRRMVKNGELPYTAIASKRLISLDNLLNVLQLGNSQTDSESKSRK